MAMFRRSASMLAMPRLFGAHVHMGPIAGYKSYSSSVGDHRPPVWRGDRYRDSRTEVDGRRGQCGPSA